MILTGCGGGVTAPCTDEEKAYLAEMAPAVEAGIETLGRLEAELVAASKDLPNWNQERLTGYYDLYGHSSVEPLKQSLLQTRSQPTAANVEYLLNATTEALELGNAALKKLNNLCPVEEE